MMTVPRRLALALALGTTLGISCFNEPLPSPTFRFACDGDADCGDGEFCRVGLCERACTQATAATDCPSEDGYAACFNGACSNTCGLDTDTCAGSSTCLDLGFGQNIGICGLECDAGDNADICPEGEVCVAGFGTCAIDCSAGQACPESFECLFGVCAPEGTEVPGGSPPDGGSSSGDPPPDASTGTEGDESGSGGAGSTTG